jgi:hypothetical protein
MKKTNYLPDDVLVRLDELDISAQIPFLEDHLKTSSNLSLEQIAQIYELLGDLHAQSGKTKHSFFKKSASAWETLAVLRYSQEKDASQRRKLLKHALELYRRAYTICKKQKLFADSEEITSRIETLKKEYVQTGNKIRTLIVATVFSAFIISFLLISSSFTGLVIVPLNQEETFMSGFAVAGLAALGTFIVIWKWRRA